MCSKKKKNKLPPVFLFHSEHCHTHNTSDSRCVGIFPQDQKFFMAPAGCPTILVTNLSGTRDQFCGRQFFFSTDLREMRDGSGSNVNNGSDGEWRMKLPLLASCLSLALRPRSWRPLSYNVIQFWHCLSPQDKGSVLWDCLPTSWLQMPVLSPDHHLCF